MKRLLVCALVGALIGGCGPRDQTQVVAVASEFSLTDEQKAKCPKLPQFVDRIKAKLIVEGVTDPCPLTVSLSGTDTLKVAGACTGIPFGKDLLFTLLWYAVAPTTGNEIELAESVGRAPLSGVTVSSVDIDFDPTKPNQASLKPRTSAGVNETQARKDTFNCDRTGTNVCDSTASAPPSTGTDVDTCSNLQELCQDTLFTNSIDQCPPGPRVP